MVASFAACRSALFTPLLLAAVALAQQRMCPISDLDQFNNIARICCEGSTGAADCSAGFPPTCTRACAELLEPFWTSCGTLVKVLGDMYPADENAIDRFAKGQCHHTNSLFEHAAVGICPEEMLAVWTDDVNSACCEQNGVWECGDGTPWSCNAECALEFGPFWERCMLGSGIGNAADMQAFSALYDTCKALPLGEARVLIHTVDELVNDPWCSINTTGIISIDAANAACTVDESAFCERTIQSGLFTCEADYCSTCTQSHACDHTCSLPCVGQAGGPAIGATNGEAAPVCETDSFMACQRTIEAGVFSCASDYCLTCPQAHSCDNTCSLPCGNTADDGDGHRRQLNGDQSSSTVLINVLNATPTSSGTIAKDHQQRRRAQAESDGGLFDWSSVNSPTCPIDALLDRAHEVERHCCGGGECPNGLPDECTFDCGRFFTSFLTACNETIHSAFSEQTVSEYAAFSDECSRMDPMSMVRAIDHSFCTTCGNNVTQAPLEQCDDGTDNSYEPDACRPNCLLPSCGDGVQDSAEFCDNGEANAVGGPCLSDCTFVCRELAPVAGVTISQSAELLPSSIATYACDDTGEPPADGNSIRTCQRNGTWTGESPTVCDPCAVVDCGDYGTCSDGVCTCSHDFSGDRCERSPWVPQTQQPSTSCTATCQDAGGTCSNGRWGSSSETTMAAALEGAGVAAHQRCTSFSGDGGGDSPLLRPGPGSCHYNPGSSSCSAARHDSWLRLCKCNFE
jgi:hypothetical protein